MSQVEIFTRTCMHFTSLLDERCAAGIRYRDAMAEGKYPCVRPSLPCEQRELPSEAEREAFERQESEVAGQVRRGLAALAAVREAIKGKALPTSGWALCPSCGQRMHYSVAKNGHVAAECDMPGCVDFRQ